MTLTTHAVWGAAAAVALRQEPALGMAAALLSHYLLDTIPHWDYGIFSLHRDSRDPLRRRFTLSMNSLKDALRIGSDFLCGLAVAALAVNTVYPDYILLGLGGALIAILPDFLQFIYFVLPIKPLAWHQVLHSRMHTKNRWRDEPVLGLFVQLVLVLVAASALL
ncbi:MAG: hypothetical protein AAB686_01350 [Patescibacteria group bacterium]